MVACKFFQQGNCRYGQNCKYDHIYGSKYSYHANPSSQTSNPPVVTDEQLVNQVHSDLQAALKGGQWPLSCYAPFKEKPNFPGITDLSAEEARLFIYEAKANNNIEPAVTYMNNLFNETQRKYEQLLQPSPAIVKVLRSLYKGEIVASPFTTNTPQSGFGGNNATSVFRSAVQTGFNQTNTSIFGQQGNQNSVFTNQNPDPAKSIFAQASQNVFQQSQPTNNLFGMTNDSAKSIFAQANQNVTPGNTQNASSIFATASQNIFGPNVPQSSFVPQANIFQSAEPANVFATNAFQQSAIQDDPSVYSKMEDLTEDDIQSFKSNDFKMGFVPEIAPPHSLCV